MMNEVANLFHSRYLNAQRLYRFSISPQCVMAVKLATKQQVQELLETSDLERLRQLVRLILHKDIDNKTAVELRKMGRDYAIKDYNRLPKSSLLFKLKQRISDASSIDTSIKGILAGDEVTSTTVGNQGRQI